MLLHEAVQVFSIVVPPCHSFNIFVSSMRVYAELRLLADGGSHDTRDNNG